VQDLAADGDNVLAAEGLGDLVQVGVDLRIEAELRYAAAIPQGHEDHAAKISRGRDPPGQQRGLAHVSSAKRSAVMRSLVIWQCHECLRLSA
jgi:hypothetical protein